MKRTFKLVHDFALTQKTCVCFACLLVAYLLAVLYFPYILLNEIQTMSS